MRAGVLATIFAAGLALLGALACSRGSFSTYPIDMSAAMSPQLFQIRVDRLECAREAAVGDTLHLRFWGLVGKAIPDHMERRKWLREKGWQLDTLSKIVI